MGEGLLNRGVVVLGNEGRKDGMRVSQIVLLVIVSLIQYAE